MRFRLLAFFPVAAGLTLLFLFSASSFVSAVEKAVEQNGRRERVAWIPVSLMESECDALYREIHALSHEITSCGADPLCLGSPILCPGALDSNIDREYARLRSELNDRCGAPLELMDYAWGGPAWGDRGRGGSWSVAARGSDSASSSAFFQAPRALTSSSASHSSVGRHRRVSSSDSEGAPNQCGAAHDWLESAASGDAEPSQYLF